MKLRAASIRESRLWYPANNLAGRSDALDSMKILAPSVINNVHDDLFWLCPALQHLPSFIFHDVRFATSGARNGGRPFLALN